MYNGETVAVVVPAYNEEGFVGEVIDTVPEFVDRVFAVDDCSTDGTWDEIRQRADSSRLVDRVAAADGGSAAPVVVARRHETNKGVGGAIKTGYRLALDAEIDVVAVMNGDGQMDPDILDRILDPIVDGRADYVKGNRLLTPEHRDDMSRWRFLGNGILTLMTKAASGYWKMNDPQNGYTAISRRALEDVDVESLYDRYGFLNDLLVRLNARGFRVADVTMQAVYGDEQTHIDYRSFVPQLSLLLLKRFLWRLKTKYLVLDFHPLVFFYALGAVGLLAGVSSLLWGAYDGGHTVLSLQVGLLIVLVSCLSVVWAITYDMRYNRSLENHSRL